MKVYFPFLGLLILMANATVISCDIDSERESVKIGEQEWMRKNLAVSHFRNGDLILEVKTDKEWEVASNTGQPAWCYYDNNPANDKETGKLYNWFAVNDTRGLAPEGWHVPTRKEWNELEINLRKNKSRFPALSGGFRHMQGNFRLYGVVGYWWSSTETDAKVTAWHRQLSYENGLKESNAGKGTALSIRCIKD